jgi:hypothetical protein
MTRNVLTPVSRIAAKISIGMVVVAMFSAINSKATAQSPTAGLDCENRVGRPQQAPLEADFIAKLSPLRSCQREADSRTACNRFVGRALEILFGNSDFRNGLEYMLANDIYNGLTQPGNLRWRELGPATNQVALDEAQRLANDSKPVVAARLGAVGPGGRRAGHVALILPGATADAVFSDDYNWGLLRTPNSASEFLDRADRMYMGCPLSVAWKRPTDVRLFTKP